MIGKEAKRKIRLTFEGFNLYPTYLKIRENGELAKLISMYSEVIENYYKSIGEDGSDLDSKPIIVQGPKEELEKFLSYFLLKNDNLQGKKFDVGDLMVIRDHSDDEDYSSTFLGYPEMAIAYIHADAIDYGNMKEWRDSNVMQSVTSRQRNRLPEIVLSEKILPNSFRDNVSYIYIDLYNKTAPVEINRKEKTSTNGQIYKTIELKDSSYSSFN